MTFPRRSGGLLSSNGFVFDIGKNYRMARVDQAGRSEDGLLSGAFAVAARFKIAEMDSKQTRGKMKNMAEKTRNGTGRRQPPLYYFSRLALPLYMS